ncbi:hypothetical protein NM73696_0384 [Neisseria meningitidis 73696]|nr:hypothetical protein NM73696_0384 [Neisseria meningitidis 73696]CWM18317.1 Uncharacterised protein [Neisseria meningitidis]CWO37700.1 Uncharacterised protein [Neisseria meningitidis]CWQ21411.1 Uncharacterised protein [Neisseria meningitidis]CWS41569.1 Uncharacterised protein [Neisseria meningitidis]
MSAAAAAEVTLLAVSAHWVMGHFVIQFPAVMPQTLPVVSLLVGKAVKHVEYPV